MIVLDNNVSDFIGGFNIFYLKSMLIFYLGKILVYFFIDYMEIIKCVY